MSPSEGKIGMQNPEHTYSQTFFFTGSQGKRTWDSFVETFFTLLT